MASTPTEDEGTLPEISPEPEPTAGTEREQEQQRRLSVGQAEEGTSGMAGADTAMPAPAPEPEEEDDLGDLALMPVSANTSRVEEGGVGDGAAAASGSPALSPVSNASFTPYSSCSPPSPSAPTPTVDEAIHRPESAAANGDDDEGEPRLTISSPASFPEGGGGGDDDAFSSLSDVSVDLDDISSPPSSPAFNVTGDLEDGEIPLPPMPPPPESDQRLRSPSYDGRSAQAAGSDRYSPTDAARKDDDEAGRNSNSRHSRSHSLERRLGGPRNLRPNSDSPPPPRRRRSSPRSPSPAGARKKKRRRRDSRRSRSRSRSPSRLDADRNGGPHLGGRADSPDFRMSPRRKKDLPRYDVRGLITQKKKKRKGGRGGGDDPVEVVDLSDDGGGNRRGGRRRRRRRSSSGSPPARRRSRSPFRRSRSPFRRASRSPQPQFGARHNKSPIRRRSKSPLYFSRLSRSKSPSFNRRRRRSLSPVSSVEMTGGKFKTDAGARRRRGLAPATPTKTGRKLVRVGEKKKRAKSKSPEPVVVSKKTKKAKKGLALSTKAAKEATKKKKKSKETTTKKASKKKAAKKAKSSRKAASVVSGGRRVVTATTPANATRLVEKEIFASGENILVSVNFGNGQQGGQRSDRQQRSVSPEEPEEEFYEQREETAAERAERNKNLKPDLVIDIMQSPYQVFEPSPKEVVDIYTDDEGEKGTTSAADAAASNRVSPSTPPQPAPASQSPANLVMADAGGLSPIVANVHKGPCTPPLIVDHQLDLPNGPQTPADNAAGVGDDDGGDGVESTYDPCDPTDSPVDRQDGGNSAGSAGAGSGISGAEAAAPSAAMTSIENTIPFLSEGNANGGGAASSGGNGLSAEAAGADFRAQATAILNSESGKEDYPMDMDMDMDSPCSPQGSDLSDLFEPPSTSLNSSSVSNSVNNNSTNAGQFLGGPVNKRAQSKKQSRASKQAKSKQKNSNKSVQMKLIDDKLKIIDDVPTSAVEMAVKEKFLKKVQRQERIVDEIKAVLKPFYNRKKISKNSYKEIMRKCVPKVCHSKNGEINTTKIQKLVKGYVKKYKYFEKRAIKP